tara:strand:+ start:4525 stop:5289 length:765 start_codon:yes stop_codon:yes gene_type:complete
LYSSRPAKAAALLGLIDTPSEMSLAPKVAALGSQGIPGAFGSSSGFPVDIDIKAPRKLDDSNDGEKGLVPSVTAETPIDSKTGGGQITTPTNPPANIVRGQEKRNSLRKQAMTEAEFNAYYGSAGDLMEATGDPSLTPAQMAAIGAGGIGVAGANRLRAKNVARGDLRNIRRQYLQAVQEGALDKQKLKLLNRELKLRGARPTLSLAPTMGIADANMAKAEQGLTSNVLKKRYRGAFPLLAASLLGTLAYNKLS